MAVNQLDRQLQSAQDHLSALRLEASRNRELQLLRPRLSLRCRLARALRNWAASLEPEVAQTATSN